MVLLLYLQGGMNMELMLAKNRDAELVYALVQETIKTVYQKYYLKEIVDMFCEFHSHENILKDIETGNTYILVENEKIIGTGTKKKIILQGFMFCRNIKKEDMELLL